MRLKKRLAIIVLAGMTLVQSSCASLSGTDALLQLELIKSQERLETKKLEVLRELRTLILSVPDETGPIAEIETDEMGKTHVKIFPQNQGEQKTALIEKFLDLQHKGIKVGSIDVERKEDLRKEVIDKGYNLARFGIGGLLMREIIGLIVHGPNWEWKGMD